MSEIYNHVAFYGEAEDVTKLKNHLLNNCNIPADRFKTNGNALIVNDFAYFCDNYYGDGDALRLYDEVGEKFPEIASVFYLFLVSCGELCFAWSNKGETTNKPYWAYSDHDNKRNPWYQAVCKAVGEEGLQQLRDFCEMHDCGLEVFDKIPEGGTEQIADEIPAANSDADDFAIDNGVLFEYTGRGGDIVIPDGVESIDQFVFSEYPNITSVVVPEGVISIDFGAFQFCENLKSISLPNSLLRFADCVFTGCSSLTNITIPAGLEDIYNGTFEACANLTSFQVDENNTTFSSLDGVLFDKDVTRLFKYPNNKSGSYYTIPNGVTDIFSYAFKECAHLEHLFIPASVTKISDSAFSEPSKFDMLFGSDSLDNEIDRHVPTIHAPAGSYAIEYAKKYDIPFIEEGEKYNSMQAPFVNQYETAANSQSNVTMAEQLAMSVSETPTSPKPISSQPELKSSPMSDFAISGGVLTQYVGNGGDVVIPSIVTEIGDSAFDGHEDITSVTIPSSVLKIGDGAFFGCTNIKRLSLLGTVEKIGEGAFSLCDGLKDEKGFVIVQDILFGASADENVVLPDGIKRIDVGLFMEAGWVKSVVIPNGVIEIGREAFENCGLTNVVLPDSVKSIETAAFWGCVDMTSIVIPASVTMMAEDVFNYCTNLTIHAPAGSYAIQYAKENGIKFVEE